MSNTKLTQYTHRPNITELGMGNTHETYMQISADTDLSQIFPPSLEVYVRDIASGKKYALKSAYGREFRVNQMGELYRDYDVLPGDEIIITKIENNDASDVCVNVRQYPRVVFIVGSNGTEIININRLEKYHAGNKVYSVSISDRGNIDLLYISFKDSRKKRQDSPNTTDYYNVTINGEKLANGTYYLTLGKSFSSLAMLPKTEYNEVSFDIAILDNLKPNQSLTTSTEIPTNNLPYITAIKTKPFLILGGFSGTGKSQKVKELAFMTCPNDAEMSKKLGNKANKPGNYCLVSVRPNWHDSSDLLGYYSSINDRYITTDFIKFLVKAMHFPKIPFFVCLDEMNLAPVEEYFAEYLSVLESRKKIGETITTDSLVSSEWFNKEYNNYDIFEDLELKKIGRTQTLKDSEQAESYLTIDDSQFERMDIVQSLKENGLCLPQNVIVIGTVNMDDTTNSFSRKVIDRAMTFETVVDTFDSSYYETEEALKYGNATTDDYKRILPDAVSAKEALAEDADLINEDNKQKIVDFINEVNGCLVGSPFQISYRILNETILYYRAKKLIDTDKKEPNLNEVFDDILMQKVLPRIEGDYDKTYKPLENLKNKAVNEGWVKSKEKITFMLGRFNSDDNGGFTSFWN